jgi:mRNA interferase MazF
MGMVIKRFEVWLVDLEPVRGSEINKTRPCIIISPDVTNHYLNTVIIAAMTTTVKDYPTRIHCMFKRKKGQVALDQMRSVDKVRLVKKLGVMDEATNKKISEVLVELFSF